MCQSDNDNTSFEAIRSGKLPGSELVIGLVGAVGADLTVVEEHLQDCLEKYGYSVEGLRVSDLLEDIVDVPDYDVENEYARINTLMTAGNEARRASNENAILALRAVYEIASWRETQPWQTNRSLRRPEIKALMTTGNKTLLAAFRPTSGREEEGPTRPRQAYVIRSLKRPEEVNALRRIYGNGFFLIGVYVAPEQRRENLIHHSNMAPEDADKLISRDEKERLLYGQRTRDTFHLSDVFVHLSETDYTAHAALQRFIDIVFSYPYKTPLFDEYAMFLAFAAATRSADLSRQIGAVIARGTDILATGANECPQAAGGTYWPTISCGDVVDSDKGRDYKRGYDSNDLSKNAIIQDAVEAIKTRFEQEGKLTDEELLRRALESSAVDDITEYGRAVHAEMDALLTCARNNISSQDAILYTTTFPCHNCAKHIIASGIRRVVYIEPYPKSKALEFHDEAVVSGFTEDASGAEDGSRVVFQPFVGIGPRRFFDLFSMTHGSGFPLERKDKSTGKILKFDPENATPRLPMLPWNYLQREGFASSIVKTHLKEKEIERDEYCTEEQGEATQSDAGATEKGDAKGG